MGEIILSREQAEELQKDFYQAESLVKVLTEKHAGYQEDLDTLSLLELTKEKLDQVRIILNEGAENSFKSGSHNDPVMDNLIAAISRISDEGDYRKMAKINSVVAGLYPSNGLIIEDFNKAEETVAMETKKKLEVAS